MRHVEVLHRCELRAVYAAVMAEVQTASLDGSTVLAHCKGLSYSHIVGYSIFSRCHVGETRGAVVVEVSEEAEVEGGVVLGVCFEIQAFEHHCASESVVYGFDAIVAHVISQTFSGFPATDGIEVVGV